MAMIPMLMVSLAYFGLNALVISAVSVLSCCVFQWIIEKFVFKNTSTISDGSAVVTGLLLAFNVPATIDMIWIVSIGALVAIGIGKMTFGGLGKNPFNPALVGRVFLLISFPVQMTTWPTAQNVFFPIRVDAMTGPTPLGVLKETLSRGGSVSEAMSQFPSVSDFLIGQMAGSLGEVSFVAIALGAIYLLFRRIITWHIPVSFILTSFVFSGILWMVNPELYLDPVHTVLSGGLMLGACFMATDMVTSPMSKTGHLIFGFGCGLLTVIIRTWGSYPEGVSFAILMMNALTPLINRWCKPTRFAK